MLRQSRNLSATLVIAALIFAPIQTVDSKTNFINASGKDQPPSANIGLVFSSYFGGSRGETGNTIAVDSRGYIYVAGATTSPDLPVTEGAVQATYGGGDGSDDSDGFVIKLSPAGGLVYATYLGGSGFDEIKGIAVDLSGNAYVTGYTRSKDFPRSGAALAGKGYRFVAKLNATGTSIVYSTRGIGGSAIAVDSSGNAYLTGSVSENDLVTTPGAFQSTFGGAQRDAFVAKLDANGKSLLYATYLGGRGNEIATSIVVDRAGYAYVAGYIDFFYASGEKEFPTTGGVVCEKRPVVGFSDFVTFVSKFNADGSALVYSTYLDAQTAYGLAIDDEGNAYVTGATRSLPASADAFQISFAGNCCYTPSQWDIGAGDGYVLKLNQSASTLVYATFLGGGSPDGGASIAVDSSGNSYVTGFAESTNFPVANPLQIAGRGLLKSTDGGVTWNRATRGLNAADVKVLVIDPTDSATLYAGSQIGLFKTTDSGGSWKAINSGLTAQSNSYQPGIFVNALVIDPLAPSTLYAATADGIYKSAVGGDAWEEIKGGYAGLLAIDPVTPTTLYTATDKVIKSTNGGQTWNDLDFGMTEKVAFVNTLTVDPTNPLVLYASVTLQSSTPESISVLKSTDGGNSWSKTSRGPGGNTPLVVDPQISSTLYMGRYKSTNGGNTWVTDGWTGDPVYSQAIDPVATSTLYLGTVQNYPAAPGVFKSTDGGLTWQATGLRGASIYVLAVDPKTTATIYAGTALNSDAFIAKLNPTGSGLAYSTYLGGFHSDRANAIAVDRLGNVYITGETLSENFVTENAFQAVLRGSGDAFVTMIGSPREAVTPKITGASISHNTLFVFGEEFDFGARILVNGEPESNTANDQQSPATTLLALKAGKRIRRGQTVTLQVRNLDGTVSPEFNYTR